MEHPDGAGTAPAGRMRVLVAAAAVLVLGLAGLGVAAAQTETPGTGGTAGSEPAPAEEKPRKGMGHNGFRHKIGFGGFGGFGRFGGGSIHGEFTVPDRDGGYRTIATQTGEVTSVSESDLGVKSEDGFTRTYTLDEDTLVNAGRDGIDDVKTGDTVRVMAVVEGGKARAVQVADTTNIRRSMERWRPGPR